MGKVSKNITIKCVQCGKKFVFSVGEQEFYRKKGFQQPKRCEECRKKNKKYKNNKSKKTIPTVVGKKNVIKTQTKKKDSLPPIGNKDSDVIGRKCGECSFNNDERCPTPTHLNSAQACDEFVSKDILTEEMKKNFPTQGQAIRYKFGKPGKSQFERAKYESN